MRITLRIGAMCVAAWMIAAGTPAAVAQTMPDAPAQRITRSTDADGKLGFGSEGLPIPAAIPKNMSTPRTAQLLGEALETEASEPRRVQLIHELGLTGQPGAVPALG